MELQCINISKNFGELKALKNVSFNVENKDIFGIAGPNGSGKTTLFNVITGHLSGSGEIIFNNENLNRLAPHEICHRGIGRIFQVPVLFNSLTVFENVKIGAIFGSQFVTNINSETQKWIEYVGLKNKINYSARDLDLFDTKLVILAATLATNPKILCLDEPMAGFSLSEIREFTKLIYQVNDEKNITILIIEHLIEVLIDICNKLMVLSNGEVLTINKPDKVFEEPEVIKTYLGMADYVTS